MGRAGAVAYAEGKAQGLALLLTFLMLITAFLSAFVAVVSVVAVHHQWLPPAVNMAVTSALLIFGVGSYFIEVAYLITERGMPC